MKQQSCSSLFTYIISSSAYIAAPTELCWITIGAAHEKVGEEGILRIEFAESQLGSISAPITPLQIFMLANAAFAHKATPGKREKLLLLGNFPGRFSNSLGPGNAFQKCVC
ncbi:hypothetical protein OIU77_014943 [Salix suchowensis]|uniref:Uncharacterized protein n=1 Tax=Salix suchowensis TaxID=1278906 RepID=A0ABQ8ZZ03_9ROSI|nr:hypothetical protein OIU77_014943 [Salix suchowensis]